MGVLYHIAIGTQDPTFLPSVEQLCQCYQQLLNTDIIRNEGHMSVSAGNMELEVLKQFNWADLPALKDNAEAFYQAYDEMRGYYDHDIPNITNQNILEYIPKLLAQFNSLLIRPALGNIPYEEMQKSEEDFEMAEVHIYYGFNLYAHYTHIKSLSTASPEESKELEEFMRVFPYSLLYQDAITKNYYVWNYCGRFAIEMAVRRGFSPSYYDNSFEKMMAYFKQTYFYRTIERLFHEIFNQQTRLAYYWG